MQRVLKLERSPPAALSLRFFLTAPLFALLAGAALLWQGESAFASRWSPAVLAATHLLTLGVLTMVMSGALFQLLPVVAGADIAHAHVTARATHALLCAGTLLLGAAFWFSRPLLFALALAPLLLALCSLLAVFGAALWRAPRGAAGAMLAGVRAALAALVPTMVLGAAMAAALAWPRPFAFPFPFLLFTDLHALWGLIGWVALLLVGVSYQVIPMFQVTALYPRAITRALVPAAGALLLALTGAQLGGHWSAAPLRLALFGALALFAGVTLWLLARRKRPAPDSTTLFWRTAMASLLACAALWYVPVNDVARTLLLGVLFMFGFACSAVMGMLYKIVPFLLWHHWQEQGLGRPVPGIRQVIPEPRALAQFRCHAAALALLAMAALWPAPLLRPAALALLGSAVLWGLNMLRAVRCGMAGPARGAPLAGLR